MTPFERRTRTCQERLRATETDAVVLFPSANCYYLGGFWEEPQERHLLLFVPREGDPVFLVPELYADQVRAATWVEDLRTWSDGEDPRDLVRAVCEDLSLDGGWILLDPRMWATFTQDLRAALPAATFGLADEVLTAQRLRKDDAELDAVRRASKIADDVALRVRDLGDEAVGTSERDLARRIDAWLADAGGEEPAFETVVASGPNAARPHHSPGDRTIRAGDPVVLDFGTRVEHYPSDQTRTVVFAGDPPDGFADAFEAVREAQTAAVEAVEPGAVAGEVDDAARSTLAAHGYGDAFVHRTGHGVGLDVHEPPEIGPGAETGLEPGMVFSVEPGVYLPDEFGVRVEDLVAVTDDGCERLNRSPRDWRVE